MQSFKITGIGMIKLMIYLMMLTEEMDPFISWPEDEQVQYTPHRWDGYD
jgi:hypothetical protein